MNTQETIQTLKKQYQSKDWFFDIEQDNSNNIVVYVKYLSWEVMKAIPDKMDGHSIFTHFAASKIVDSKQFITDASTWQPPKPQNELVVDPLKLELSGIKLSKMGEIAIKNLAVKPPHSDLIGELDRLALICGDNILQDIFYEIHDGKNALTNLSPKFPEVRKSMEKIYDMYGFETINEEWE